MSNYTPTQDQPSSTRTMSQFDEISGWNDSSFLSLDAISAYEFVIKKLWTLKIPWSHEEDFLDAKKPKADGLKARTMWSIIFRPELQEDDLAVGEGLILSL